MGIAMQEKIILATGAASALVNPIVKAASQSGHTVYAAIDPLSTNSDMVADYKAYAREFGVDIRIIALDAMRDSSAREAVDTIVRDHGRLDIVVQTDLPGAAASMETVSPASLAASFDQTIGAAHRVSRATVPTFKKQGEGLLVWIISQGAAGAVVPHFGPSFLLSSCLDALATQYAHDLAPHGIETTIILSGLQLLVAQSRKPDTAKGANGSGPISHAESEESPATVAMRQLASRSDGLGRIAGAVVEAIDTPKHFRPLRIHAGNLKDGSDVSYHVVDRMRSEFLHRMRFDQFIQKFSQIK